MEINYNNSDIISKVEHRVQQVKSKQDSNVLKSEKSFKDYLNIQKSPKNNINIASGPKKDEVNGTDFALKQAAKEVETQLHSMLWNTMFAGIERTFEGGFGEEMFFPMLIEETVKLMNQSDNLGPLAQSIYEQTKSSLNLD